MGGSAPKQWGVTPPISMVGPTDAENAVNQALVEELKRQNSFELPEESQKRIAVLNQLQKVTEEFVRQVCAAKGLPEAVIKSSGGKIFTFGSYRLGVYGPGKFKPDVHRGSNAADRGTMYPRIRYRYPSTLPFSNPSTRFLPVLTPHFADLCTSYRAYPGSGCLCSNH